MVTRTLIRVTSPEAAALAATNASASTIHNNKNGGGKKRALPPPSSCKVTKKRQRADGFVIDLSGVPPQQPIPKSKGRMKEGSSKYAGVSLHKLSNKWKAEITIEGKQRCIGYYEIEEEAAIDYARAVFKYKGETVLDKAREQKSSKPAAINIISGKETTNKRRRTDRFVLDLNGVPPQPPILKREGHIKEGSSKYTGVSFNKKMNKWKVDINIEGKTRYLGCYENEEEAAAQYARALFKYKGQEALDKARGQTSSAPLIDLSDVPPQLPILKSANSTKEGISKYVGVCFNKPMNKWQAQIMIDGKSRHIGYYENEEEAAIDYARAVFKFEGQGAIDKDREQNSPGSGVLIDLNGVPPQLPISKSGGWIKEGASKYTGVTFKKGHNKWKAAIRIEGKQQCIGYYKDEEEAAIDYARALFKYKGQDALDKARECRKSALVIDLSDVPPQPPILRSASQVRESSSKYAGVCFHKTMNKWQAEITIKGKGRHIGLYEKEEEAAIDYARAVFRYKRGALDKAREQAIDLSEVPPQQPIPKREAYIKEGSSKYTGVTFDKRRNKWQAHIRIDGNLHRIGYYENEEEAAIDYARAKFKYKGQEALDKAMELKQGS